MYMNPELLRRFRTKFQKLSNYTSHASCLTNPLQLFSTFTSSLVLLEALSNFLRFCSMLLDVFPQALCRPLAIVCDRSIGVGLHEEDGWEASPFNRVKRTVVGCTINFGNSKEIVKFFFLDFL